MSQLSFLPQLPKELASGVDALYLSGRSLIPDTFLARLEAARSASYDMETGPPFQFGLLEMRMSPHGWGKYRYLLEYPHGRIGITQSSELPTFRIQPYAEFLHGESPRGVVDWFQRLLEMECEAVELTVSRLDLFADFQGWVLDGDARNEFLCRAKARNVFEDDGVFNGLTFGRRTSESITARLYDKTIQSAKVGSGYWPMIWGDAYDRSQSVLRVEFELHRPALRQFDLGGPYETLDAIGALWAYLTGKWLTHRVPGEDETKSRWAVSEQWENVQRARIAQEAHGVNRMLLGKRRGYVDNILPGLVGYLSSFGAYSDCSSLAEMLPQLEHHVRFYTEQTGMSLVDRIQAKRRKMGLE
jgi:hypothetical protein